MRLITLNVNGIVEKQKRDKLFDYIRNFNADIIFLQETHNETEQDERTWTSEWGGTCLWNRGTHRSCGVAILFNQRAQVEITNTLKDNKGRILAATVNINGTGINLMNLYAPTIPRERKSFFDELWDFKPGDHNLMLAGDFNCVPNTSLDKQGGNPQSGTVGIVELNDFCNVNQLVDIWRDTHERDKIFTWSNRDFSLRSRLDRWYVPQVLQQRTTSTIRACPHSDHSVVEIVTTPTQTQTRGKGTWKLNVSILKDRVFQREIRAFYTYWVRKKDNFESIVDWWDEAKCRFKQIAIGHSVRKARNRRQNEANLQQELTTMKNELHPDTNRIHELEQQINQLVTTRIEGVKVRSRATWFEEGEKPTKYFFNLERAKQDQACISKLSTDNGEVTSNEQILAESRRFYEQLYTSDPVDTEQQESFLNQLDRKLDDKTRATCEGPVTQDELTAALNKMHLSKSPGPDGLPVEFYKTFWAELVTELVEVLNANYLNGTMSISQRESLLRLLFKKGRRDLLPNWRPISLLNTDYKILSTLLANRIRPTLPDVIHEDQTCGIPGRTIFDSVQRLRDMAHEATTKNLNLILIGLDQEKAFDRVDRDFLIKIMEKLNYGPSFIRWIETLYYEANCRITNNGWLSGKIHLHRGVRQGCPLSPLLYTMIIETLSNAIRKDSRIEGFSIPGCSQTSKISAYADDGTLTLKDDLSVTRAFDQINNFERASGGKLNLGKTEGSYIGQQAGREHGPVPIKWRTTNIRVLGTNIGNDMNQDWETPAEKVEKTLERWSTRQLTMKGKAVILRTYAIATIVYLASMFPLPVPIVTRLHRAVFNFLWGKKNELVSRETCHLPFNKGGLAIPDLHIMKAVVQIKWISHLTNRAKSTIWLDYGRYWTGQVLGNIKDEWKWLRSNLKPHGHPGQIPIWYHEIVKFAQQNREILTHIPSDQLTSQRIKELLQKPHLPRCETIWKRYIHPPPQFQATWRNLWASKTENKVKEFLWKLIHRVLTTKDYLIRWGMQVNPTCPFCQHREDTQHAILLCQRAQEMWKDLQPLLTSIAGRQIKVDVETILFHRNLPSDDRAKEICHYILAKAAELLWHTRNKRVYDHAFQPGNMKNRVIQAIRKRIQMDFIINSNRIDQLWGHKGVIVKLQNGQLIFNI